MGNFFTDTFNKFFCSKTQECHKKDIVILAQPDNVVGETVSQNEIKKEEIPVFNDIQEENIVCGANSYYGKYVVCLDPGHSIMTNGKRSPYTLYNVLPELPFEEWLFNRVIVSKIADRLKAEGIDVFITTTSKQDGSTDVGLTERAMRANRYVAESGKKGIFISVHSNAQGNGNEWTNAKGWSVYTTKGQNQSDKFATIVYNEAEKILVPMGISMRKDMSDGDPDWEENFTVIVKANMPAILTENLFYTNINDTKFLNSEKGIEAIVLVHVQGILSYIESLE